MAEVEIIGMDRLISRLVRVEESLDPAAERAVKTVAKDIRDTAKEIVPVDTGSLKKSIRTGAYAMPAGHTHSVRVTAGGYVTNPKTKRKVDYASHVEYGTSRGRAQPYLIPAFEAHKRELIKTIKEFLR